MSSGVRSTLWESSAKGPSRPRSRASAIEPLRWPSCVKRTSCSAPQGADGFRHLANLGARVFHVVGVVDRHDETDAGAAAQHVVPAPDQLRAHLELVREPELDIFRAAVGDTPEAPRERAPARAYRQNGAKPRFARRFAVGVAVGGIVGAVDVVASAQQRHGGGDAGLQALELREPRFGAPEIDRRMVRVDRGAGAVPGGPVARPQ